MLLKKTRLRNRKIDQLQFTMCKLFQKQCATILFVNQTFEVSIFTTCVFWLWGCTLGGGACYCCLAPLRLFCFLLTVCQAFWQSAPRCNGCYWDWRSNWMHVDAFLHVLKWVSILSVNLSARVKHVSHALLGVAVKVFFVCSLLPDPLHWGISSKLCSGASKTCTAWSRWPFRWKPLRLPWVHSWLLCAASCPQTSS